LITDSFGYPFGIQIPKYTRVRSQPSQERRTPQSPLLWYKKPGSNWFKVPVNSDNVPIYDKPNDIWQGAVISAGMG